MLAFKRVAPAEGLAHNSDLKRWGLPCISQSNSHPKAARYLLNFGTAGDEIGSQLPFCGFVRASNEIAGGEPESKGGEKQQGGERGYKRIGDFKSVAVERRPELGSLIFAVLCLGLAFPTAAFASDR